MSAHASMNRIFRLVWNESLGGWVAVAENARGRGKRSTRAASIAPLLATLGLGLGLGLSLGMAEPANAAAAVAPPPTELPKGGKVVAGGAVIVPGRSTPAAAVLNIDQTTQRAVIDWLSFNLGSAAQVNFNQPSAGAATLNRVLDTNPSQIFGKITATGQVFLTNPNGVYFGKSAAVDVGSLTATSLAIGNADFMAGKTTFTRDGATGSIVNEGELRAALGGFIALLGPEVSNRGVIVARLGTVAMASGEAVTLNLEGSHLAGITVQPSAIQALVENRGAVMAPGGVIILSAKALDRLQGGVVRNSGTLEATGLSTAGGRIALEASDSVADSGRLDVSSASGGGGAITVTGRDITLAGGATLDASGATGGGSIRVGGGFQGKDADVANAASLGADASVTARADATGSGAGGNIVFWSDDATRFAGNLSVRGGPQGGDGGNLEVSGKRDLSYSGRADARAPLGRTGNLLLDPATLTISGGGTGSGVLTGTTVFEKDLEAQNANVLLQATGNVTFNDLNLNGGDGKISMANNVSLRVESDTGATSNAVIGDITFANAANTIEVFGTGSLIFIAGSLGMGNIVNAPNLIAHGAGTNPMTLPIHNVAVVGSGTPGNGSITLFGADGVTVGGAVTTNGGYVRIWADSDNAGGGGYTMSAPVVTTGGNLYVSAGDDPIVLNSNMTLGAGRILFAADGTHSGGARTLGGVLSASGAVNVSTPFTMNAGSGILTDGVITFSNTVNLNTGAGALTLRGSAIDFTAATLTNLSTASLILQPADPSTSMVLGDAGGFASATTLAKLPGVKNLTIGRTDGTGATSVASNFSFAATGMLEVVNSTVAVTGGTLTNTAGNVTLTGDNVNISKQVTSNAGTGAVTLRQLTAATPINLGTGLPNSVLGQINAATLVIGRSDGGDVTFATDIATNASTVHLLSGGQVIGTAGGVSAANLAINAGGGATLSAPAFNFSRLALAVGGPTAITQTNSGFAIAAVDGVAGLAITAGSNANVTLQGQGAITASGALALAGNTSTLTLDASSVNLASSSVSGAANASFALRPLNAADSLAIGGTGAFATAATLAKLTNSRNVTVGRSDGTGLSTVTALLSLAESGTLELVNGQLVLGTGSVTNSGAGGGVKLTALTGNLTLNSNVNASGQVTLAAANATSVTGTGNISAASLLIDAAAAAVGLNGGANAVGTIAGNAGSLSFVDTIGLAVGSVGGVNGVHSAGSLLMRTTGATADITLNQAVSGSAAGNAVVLASARNFIDNSGASAISAGGGGRWLVYSGSPLTDTRGGLANAFKQYNASYGSSVLGSGSGFVYRVAPVVTLGLIGSTAKVYDGATGATLTSGNYSVGGAIDGDTVSFAGTGAAYASKVVGTGKSVSATGLSLTGASNGAANVFGYQLASSTATANIGQVTPATLTVGAATVADKVYDATVAATVGGVALAGVIGSDAIGTTATGAFADKNVGIGKAVAVGGIVLTGADAGNYVLNTTSANGTANITRATLAVGGATVADKVYDASTAASVSGVALTGVIGSDAIGTTATGAFAGKNVGNGKAVTVSAVALTGADAGNYVLNTTSSNGVASITPATLTVGVATVADKVYDATPLALVNGVGLAGVLGSDAIGTTATGAFADKNVGNGKGVAVVGIALTGADAGNYVLNTTSSSGTASITPATLTVGVATIADKVYDATPLASVSGVGLTGTLGSDAIGTTASGAFADKNVGSGKAVTVSAVALTGADAGNYVLNTTNSSGVASITAATLTVGGATIADKVYDATQLALVSAVGLTGVIGTDAIGTTGSGAFADKNVGSGKAVTVGSIALTGADAGNYLLNTTSSIGTASITPATLTVGVATIASKVYDATTLAAVSGVGLTGVLGSDAIGTTASGAFADKNVSNGKAVAVGGIGLTGADAGNYLLNTTSSIGTAGITPATLTVGVATIADKIYDATPLALVSGVGLTGVIGTDAIGTTGTGAFADKNVGNSKAVTVGSIALTGADAGNYLLNTTSSIGTAGITPATLTVGVATIASKVYDATTLASVSGVGLTGVMGSDAIAATANGIFADKNVGSAKAVTVGSIALTGVDAGNYVLNATNASGTASITPATLTVGVATIADKVYDATLLASVSAVALTGVLGSDAIGTSATGAFADKNVGNGKPVTVGAITLTGADSGNYVLNAKSSSGTASIAPATLTVAVASGVDKVYDATTGATVVLSGNALAGDALTLGYGSAAFADKNVGNGKTVTVGGVTASGVAAGNYTFSTVTTTTADITPATIAQITGIGVADKIYDGTTSATLVAGPLGFVGMFAGDRLTANPASAVFVDKNAGIGKSVIIGGLALAGADAGNYTLASPSGTSVATITPAALVVSASAANKVYDATTAAAVVLSETLLGSDVVSVGHGSVTFGDKNVGTGKTVTIGGISLSGADAGNYAANPTATTTADVTKASLTVGAVGIGKVYDTTTAATATLTDNRLGNDVLDVRYGGASFADKNAGTGKPVSVGGIDVTGIDARNYSFNTSASTTADIAKAPIAIAAIAQNKVYDATTGALVILSGTPLAGDAVGVAYAGAVFGDKNAGAGKSVTVSGIRLSGADAGNYTPGTTVATTADITPASLAVAAIGRDKLYDGTDLAAVTLTDNRYAGDQLWLAPTNVIFGDAGAGKAKPISVVGIHMTGGADEANYVLANTTASASAGIAAFFDSWSVPPVVAPTIVPRATTAPPSVLDLTLPSGTVGGFGVGAAGPGAATAVLAPGDSAAGITVSLVTSATVEQSGLITVSVPSPMVSSGKSFSFPLPQAVFESASPGVLRVTLMDGSSLPAWLRYDPIGKAFNVGGPPAGGLPIEVLLRFDDQSWTVVVEEQS